MASRACAAVPQSRSLSVVSRTALRASRGRKLCKWTSGHDSPPDTARHAPARPCVGRTRSAAQSVWQHSDVRVGASSAPASAAPAATGGAVPSAGGRRVVVQGAVGSRLGGYFKGLPDHHLTRPIPVAPPAFPLRPACLGGLGPGVPAGDGAALGRSNLPRVLGARWANTKAPDARAPRPRRTRAASASLVAMTARRARRRRQARARGLRVLPRQVVNHGQFARAVRGRFCPLKIGLTLPLVETTAATRIGMECLAPRQQTPARARSRCGS